MNIVKLLSIPVYTKEASSLNSSSINETKPYVITEACKREIALIIGVEQISESFFMKSAKEFG